MGIKGSMYSALTSDENWGGQPFGGHKSSGSPARCSHNPPGSCPRGALLTGPLVGCGSRCAWSQGQSG